MYHKPMAIYVQVFLPPFNPWFRVLNFLLKESDVWELQINNKKEKTHVTVMSPLVTNQTKTGSKQKHAQ